MKTRITKAAIFAVLTAFAVLITALASPAIAATPPTTDLTDTFRGAGAAVNQLQVYEIAGIVIIRGRTSDKAQAELLSRYARSLGYQRVANLVATTTHDDAAIARKAERELSVHRALEGCRFRVRSEQGVVKLAGRVRHELQKDVAMQILRTIDGVQRIEMTLDRF